MTPHQWLQQLLDLIGSKPLQAASRQCPAHHDATPSLSCSATAQGGVLLKCHAGCSIYDIMAKLALPLQALFRTPRIDPALHAQNVGLTLPDLATKHRNRSPLTDYILDAIHTYTPTHRLLRYRHPTNSDKRLYWEHFDQLWLPGLDGLKLTDLPLYRLPPPTPQPLALVESESSVDAFYNHGLLATTWAGGSQNPPVEQLYHTLKPYPGRVWIPDNDTAGFEASRLLSTKNLDKPYLLPAPGSDARDLLITLGSDALRAHMLQSLDVSPSTL